MLHWTLIFLLVALVAGLLGFMNIGAIAMDIARILFIVFLVLFLVTWVPRVIQHHRS